MMMKAKVYVTLKNGILDPQGKAVQRSLDHLGYSGVSNVRLGKYIEIEMASMPIEDARKKITEMCEKLLANTVIEDFRMEIDRQ